MTTSKALDYWQWRFNAAKFEGEGRDREAFYPRLYWTLGKGGARIAWGFQGDLDRCILEVTPHLGGDADYAARLCQSYHKDLFGHTLRQSEDAGKPPVPTGWDFDAESPENAMKPNAQ